jgi:hypothetical protein
MPRSISETSSDLNSRLKKSGDDILKMTWLEFYQIGALKRLTTVRWNELVEHSLEEHSLILGWGQNYVLLARDEEHYNL